MGFNHNRIGNFNLPISLLIFFFIITGISSFAQTNWNTELLGRWAEGTCDAVEVDENYLYVGNGSYIDVYEDQEEPVFIVRLETPGIIRDIIRDGDYLYIANEEYGLRIFNVSNINNPYETGFLLLPGYTQKLLLRDSLIYSANFHGGMSIINVENPYNPVELSNFQNNNQVIDLAIKDEFIFITQNDGFRVLDISDPIEPILIRYVFIPGGCEGLAVKNEDLFVISIFETIIFSLVDPTNPDVKYYTNEIYGNVLSITNNRAFITYFDEIKIVDISEPDTLSLLEIINSYGQKKSLRFKNNVMYVADSYYGLVIIDIDDINNPIFKYHIPSAYNTNYLVADSNYVYISDMGLRIIDVSDPTNPTRVGTFQTIYGTDKIYKKDNLIFLADGNIDGLRIIDVAYPNYPLELSQINTPYYINSISVYQKYLYLAQGDSLGIWDIEAPYEPIHINTIHLTGYCSELIIKDSLLITCQAPPGGILMYNLNNPALPNLISTYMTEYEGQHLASQGNYIIGGSYAGFEIIDITNPTQPYQLSFFSTPYTYDLAAVNNYLYIAFAEAGIKVYDLHNISSPQEVGYYDTKGIAWSVDCWNDKIFVADSRYGMPIIRNTLITSMNDQQAIALQFLLSQNYPNPFNPSTNIKYSIPQSSVVELKVFDILGSEIETLVNEVKPAGTYEVTWYVANLPSGVYFYQLKTGSFIETKKMILLR